VSASAPLPYAWVRSHGVMLSEVGGESVLLGTAETAAWAVAELRRRHGPLPFQALDAATWQQRLGELYRDGGDAAAVVGAAESEVDLDRLMQDMPEVTDLLDAQDDAPVIRMINALLAQAARDGASDLHIEPFETHSVVRYRVDGTLRDMVQPRRALHAALVSRIKIMAHLDIAEKRLPQDGRIAIRVGGRPLDIRVSTVPTAHGERAVLRLLEKDAGRLQLQRLGMADDTLATFTGLIRQPHGIVLVTGPTGSGKTTSRYAALGQLDSSTSNILTVEDPVEYDFAGIGQIQVNARIGMSFGTALRAILRQDPDTIMIGEIRDLETAQIAVQSSLPGHGVLASSLRGVLAQRLVRRLCTQCRRADVDGEGRAVWRAVGCAACANSGYRGRTGIHELFVVDDRVRALIHEGQGEPALREAARRAGMRTLRQDGQRWVDSGVTTLEEILRVTGDD